MLSKEEVKKLESLLKSEKKRLEKEIQEMGGTEMGSDVDHGEEESDEAEEIVTKESIAYSLNERLKDINLALDKIGADAYGVCEKCGQEISLELLKAVPESRLCQNCKTSQEPEE